MAQLTFKRLLSVCGSTSGLLRNASKSVSVSSIRRGRPTAGLEQYHTNDEQNRDYKTRFTKRYRHVAVDNAEEKVSVDKNLHRLTEKWELEKAADLVTQCSLTNNTNCLPNGTTIQELLKKLSALGDIDNTLRVQAVALQHKILNKKHVYRWTAEAFYNSGKIDESIKTIEDFYTENNDFKDIVILFSQVTFRILKEFPEKIDVVVNFADKAYGLRDPKPYAALWKCYILAEQFENADSLQQTYPELKPYIAMMVNEICQKRDKIEHNEMTILKKLVDVPGLKQKLTAFLYEMLLDKLIHVFNWDETLNILQKAKDSRVKLHYFKVMSYLDTLSSYYTSGSERTIVLELQEWAETLAK
ncbi:uncharacterized protein LOC141902606 [Tubulanus polymorphus]|uniref:uncharacterized protein LOC141902606 n=1 Tax=Tubulanus polymorphus TaxID=672921 RepID=UPI003DA2BDDA